MEFVYDTLLAVSTIHDGDRWGILPTCSNCNTVQYYTCSACRAHLQSSIDGVSAAAANINNNADVATAYVAGGGGGGGRYVRAFRCSMLQLLLVEL